jgi:hypothetical protein
MFLCAYVVKKQQEENAFLETTTAVILPGPCLHSPGNNDEICTEEIILPDDENTTDKNLFPFHPRDSR